LDSQPERYIRVRLGAKLVNLGIQHLASLDPTHAISTRKAQESQFNNVIHSIARSPNGPQLLYPAMTRAVRRVALVGSRSVFEEASRKTHSIACEASRAGRIICGAATYVQEVAPLLDV
jgi:ATP-dependent exoDNAse (exonuclease V) alpha subunit